jgi:hypothetical protein
MKAEDMKDEAASLLIKVERWLGGWDEESLERLRAVLRAVAGGEIRKIGGTYVGFSRKGDTTTEFYEGGTDVLVIGE